MDYKELIFVCWRSTQVMFYKHRLLITFLVIPLGERRRASSTVGRTSCIAFEQRKHEETEPGKLIWDVDNLNLLAVVVYLFMFGNNNVMNVGGRFMMVTVHYPVSQQTSQHTVTPLWPRLISWYPTRWVPRDYVINQKLNQKIVYYKDLSHFMDWSSRQQG